jgi:hypothetical protein
VVPHTPSDTKVINVVDGSLNSIVIPSISCVIEAIGISTDPTLGIILKLGPIELPEGTDICIKTCINYLIL